MRRAELFLLLDTLGDLVECKAGTVQEAAEIVRARRECNAVLFDTLAELIECKAGSVEEAVEILRSDAEDLFDY